MITIILFVWFCIGMVILGVFDDYSLAAVIAGLPAFVVLVILMLLEALVETIFNRDFDDTEI